MSVNTFVIKPLIPEFIVLALFILRMNLAIDLNTKLRRCAIKVENVGF